MNDWWGHRSPLHRVFVYGAFALLHWFLAGLDPMWGWFIVAQWVLVAYNSALAITCLFLALFTDNKRRPSNGRQG